MEHRPWFEADDYVDHVRYRTASPGDRARIDAYRRDGYVIVNDVGVDDAVIAQVVRALAGRYTGSATGYGGGGRVQDAWRWVPAVRRIATAPRVMQTLALLYGKDPIPFQTLNFERGTEQRAHSDTIHFNTLPYGFMCGAWIALEDTDDRNGALFYHPGSQNLPIFHMEDLGLKSDPKDYAKYEDTIGRILNESPYRPVEAHLRKGQALI